MASPIHHTWTRGGPLPPLRPHSAAKLKIIGAYLDKYIKTLTKDPRLDYFKLTLVDGFAGGGLYIDSRTKSEVLGSPLLMLDTIKKAREWRKAIVSKPFDLAVKYYFIEKKREHYHCLIEALQRSEFRTEVKEHAAVINAPFTKVSEGIVQKIRQYKGRAIFILDQFGWIEVPFQEINQILRDIPAAEVILTFSVDSLITYLSDEPKCRASLRKAGIDLSGSIATLKEKQKWRFAIQSQLHPIIKEGCGAEYYTPFFIHSEDENRDFWLLHLSGHVKAKDVMTELHWEHSNTFRHYGGAGLNMLGYRPDNDPKITDQISLPSFGFDDTAAKFSHQELMDDLPRVIVDRHGGKIRYEELLCSLTNETPATSQMMRDVFAELAAYGEVIIKSKSGNERRSGKIQHKDDYVVVRRQGRLFKLR